MGLINQPRVPSRFAQAQPDHSALPGPVGLGEGDSAPERKTSEDVRFDAGRVYAEQVDFVWRVVRGMGVERTCAADVVQDIFVVVQRRLPEFDGRCAIKTWLFAIALRVVSDHRRKQRRERKRVGTAVATHVIDRSPGPSELAERREAERALHAALDRLDDDKRLVLVLADIEELTAPEIAELTGTPLNTVYTRLRRARAEFNAALGAQRRRSP